MPKIPMSVIFIGGVALGGGVVWGVSKLIYTKAPAETVKKSQPVEFAEEPLRDSSLEKLNHIIERNNGESQVEMGQNVTDVESYEHIEKNSHVYDSLRSLYRDSTSADNQRLVHDASSETVIYRGEVLKKDKLLGRETIAVIRTDEGIKTNGLDSVSAHLAGIHTNKPDNFDAEHWASPVNYKGYKLGKTRLVLFGTTPGSVKLLRNQGQLYMVFDQKVFLLTVSPGFTALKPLQDKKLSAYLLKYVH